MISLTKIQRTKVHIAYRQLTLLLLILWVGIFFPSPLFSKNDPTNSNLALNFQGDISHVMFEEDSMLALKTFTIETWFKRHGDGTTACTGYGGIIAIPLVTKGRDQAEGSPLDLNYFLGIRDWDNVLAADFEDCATGDNHPIVGSTVIPFNVWRHAAVTYDGSVLKLYLNGILEAEMIVNENPRYDSVQHAALGTAKDSHGFGQGHFDGALDEVRIWNYARSEQEISHSMNLEIKEASGLIARWGLNEGEGNTAYDSSGYDVHGTIYGISYNWIDGVPLDTSDYPSEPSLIWPLDRSSGFQKSPLLKAQVADPESESVKVTFYGRKAPLEEEFTIVTIPDTQYYSESYPHIFTCQTQWIVDNREDLNIIFATHLGDIVERADAQEYPWINANNSMSLLDNIIPYGILPGNHDMDAQGVAEYYDQYFPSSRYENESWYWEGYRNNKNSFQLFSIGSLDFIFLHLEYNPTDDVLDWADQILKAYPERRAIVSTHDYLNTCGERSQHKGRLDGNSGEDIWLKLIKQNCNVFMVLNGHYHWPNGESRLTSINDCGSSVHQILQNYQHLTNGGNGFLRYYTFKPSENKIYTYTFSPFSHRYEADDNSQFIIDYPMGVDEFDIIDIKEDVPTDSIASTIWEDLDCFTEYEWYVTSDNGLRTTTSAIWSFTTKQGCSNPPLADILCNGIDDDSDGSVDEDFVSTPTACGQGECEGNIGETYCQAGVELNTCDPYEGSSEELCDGLDNDCDGDVDEGFPDFDHDGVKDCVDPDDDGDQAMDEYDNCLFLYNPTQSDFDADQEGDFCDLNDDLIYIFFNDPNVLEWQEEAGYDSWNVYKNLLDILRETGVYTSNPYSYPYAEWHCGLTETQHEDNADPPPAGKVVFFLVTGMASGIESSLGKDSEGNERPNDNPCP